jgi:hypothetical protein
MFDLPSLLIKTITPPQESLRAISLQSLNRSLSDIRISNVEIDGIAGHEYLKTSFVDASSNKFTRNYDGSWFIQYPSGGSTYLSEGDIIVLKDFGIVHRNKKTLTFYGLDRMSKEYSLEGSAEFIKGDKDDITEYTFAVTSLKNHMLSVWFISKILNVDFYCDPLDFKTGSIISSYGLMPNILKIHHPGSVEDLYVYGHSKSEDGRYFHEPFIKNPFEVNFAIARYSDKTIISKDLEETAVLYNHTLRGAFENYSFSLFNGAGKLTMWGYVTKKNTVTGDFSVVILGNRDSTKSRIDFLDLNIPIPLGKEFLMRVHPSKDTLSITDIEGHEREFHLSNGIEIKENNIGKLSKIFSNWSIAYRIKASYPNPAIYNGVTASIGRLSQNQDILERAVSYANSIRDVFVDKSAEGSTEVLLPGEGMDDERDAFRHLYTPAWFTFKYGALTARIVMEQNELLNGDKNPEGAASVNMDTWNNNRGIMIGAAAKIFSDVYLSPEIDEKERDQIIKEIIIKISSDDIYTNMAIRNARPPFYRDEYLLDYQRLYNPVPFHRDDSGDVVQHEWSYPKNESFGFPDLEEFQTGTLNYLKKFQIYYLGGLTPKVEIPPDEFYDLGMEPRGPIDDKLIHFRDEYRKRVDAR